MEITAMSIDSLRTTMSNPNLAKRPGHIVQQCASGQTLITDKHLMPGWLCNNRYKAVPTAQELPCNTYNNLQRTNCKFCGAPQNITIGEYQSFAKKVLLPQVV